MVRYYKGDPSEYVIEFVRGRKVREGRGASFFYWPGRTSIVSVPLTTTDADFVVTEVTADFQTVALQGQITYRITDAGKAAAFLNFEIDPRTKAYRTKDPQKVPARLANLVQEAARAEIQRTPLGDALKRGAELSGSLEARLRNSPDLEPLGVSVLKVFLTILRPTPEVAKALEAEYRETLLKRADQAIYDRRAAAVEQERKIRENELSTDITLERERERLVELKAANLEKEAEAEAKALEAKLGPYRTMDPQVLIAWGIKALGENAAKIGNLTLTPDLISELLRATRRTG
jgi:regulator of protease activity HflC (stomatin/prohibitin superfamily)